MDDNNNNTGVYRPNKGNNKLSLVMNIILSQWLFTNLLLCYHNDYNCFFIDFSAYNLLDLYKEFKVYQVKFSFCPPPISKNIHHTITMQQKHNTNNDTFFCNSAQMVM